MCAPLRHAKSLVCGIQVSVTDEEVVKAKEFALAEIIKLSDSYRDMKINKVMSSETARSVSLPKSPDFSGCISRSVRVYLRAHVFVPSLRTMSCMYAVESPC